MEFYELLHLCVYALKIQTTNRTNFWSGLPYPEFWSLESKVAKKKKQ